MILKMDKYRGNIVVSRKQLLRITKRTRTELQKMLKKVPLLG